MYPSITIGEHPEYPLSDTLVDGSYPCGQLSQFFCRLNGPLQHAQAGATQQPRLVEREAASQRLEIAARLRPEEEEAAA